MATTAVAPTTNTITALGAGSGVDVKALAQSLVDAEFDHLLVFKPTTQIVDFYFLGAWEQEPKGIKTKEEFLNYLDKKLQLLEKNNKM